MPEIINDGTWKITPPAGKDVEIDGIIFHKITQTVAYSAFTDGGAAIGTFDLSEHIPVGAIVLGGALTAVTGFAGDTSAVLTVGDGTDVDRYNTSTINVFASITGGVDLGLPSGVRYHAAQKTPKLTITSAADWGAVNAGSLTIELYYIT